MALQAGLRLGVYEVVSLLGTGGMGEVYRARDTRLGRNVALKVLPDSVSNSAESALRFKHEARTLASLNHPNIAAIYGFEESNGIHALVMELVEGATLADRIVAARSARPSAGNLHPGLQTEEYLDFAKQIAVALEYAHEHGIIHRDLKPANIKITPDGTVKVLDFGLAKVLTNQDSTFASDPANSPTLTAMATQPGIILGTAAYMSPEQAKGKQVDRRTDIWAFGCVLFEMLSGKKCFEGETISDVLAAIIRAQPDWTLLPATTPPAILRLIHRCLVKDPKHRLRDIGDARIAIEETLSGSPADEPSAPPATTTTPRRRTALWLLIAALAVIIGVPAGWWMKGRQIPAARNWSAQMLGGPSVAMGPRISPDGHTLAFQAMVDGVTQVAVMDIDSGDWTVLTKNRTRGYITELNWSPDGSEIYFDREYSVPRGIYAVSRFGGKERLVLDNAMGPEILPDGSLIVVRVNQDESFQLYRFWPDSGRTQPLDAFFTHRDLCPPVRVFRDGKDLAFFGETQEQQKSYSALYLYILNLASGKVRRLAPNLHLQYPTSIPFFPIAISHDDRSVLVDLKAGDLNRIISIPRNGKGNVRTLLTLTLPPFFMDVDNNGNLYVDQGDRPIEILRFSQSGGIPQVLASSESPSVGEPSMIQLSDGRVVVGSMVAGRSRLLAASPSGEATPFILTKEETSQPTCRVGQNEIAFILGSADRKILALASIADGRILKRLPEVPGNQVSDLAASPDGKTIYYVADRTVWAVPAAGGPPSRLAPADSIAADPNGKYLIVQRDGEQAVQLMKVAVSGGPEQPIPVLGDLRVGSEGLDPNAIAKDGRVALSVASPDLWFNGAAILDPRSGKVTKIPLDFTGDIMGPAWQDKDHILSSGWPLKVTLWRFRPATLAQQ